MNWLIVLGVGLGLGASAAAQVRPTPGNGDPHLQSVNYDPEQIIALEAAPGYQVTVELSPDEQVKNVAVGDSSAWQVSVDRAGDHLFIKPAALVASNMTVITSVRVYNFQLNPVSAPMSDSPFTVRFNYPELKSGSETEYIDVSPLRRAQSSYRISGDKMLRPDSVTNDGERTYISWSREKPIPAVYAITTTGEEALANGRMRADEYIVDGVPPKLIFRIDDHAAEALRLPTRKSR